MTVVTRLTLMTALSLTWLGIVRTMAGPSGGPIDDWMSRPFGSDDKGVRQICRWASVW